MTLGISIKNLEQLLIEHNLLFNSKGSLCILPIISFTIALNKRETYSWWLEEEESGLSKKLAKNFYKKLSFYSVKSGFYGMDPVFSRLNKTQLFQKGKTIRVKDITDFFDCHIVLSGKIFLKEGRETKSLENYIAFKAFNIQTKRIFFKIRKKILVPVQKLPFSEKEIKKFFFRCFR